MKPTDAYLIGTKGQGYEGTDDCSALEMEKFCSWVLESISGSPSAAAVWHQVVERLELT